MSQNYYFKNIEDNEYITADGNGNYRASLTFDNPKFIIWVLLNRWLGKRVICVVEHQMPNGYDFILKSTNMSDKLRIKYNEEQGMIPEKDLKTWKEINHQPDIKNELGIKRVLYYQLQIDRLQNTKISKAYRHNCIVDYDTKIRWLKNLFDITNEDLIAYKYMKEGDKR
jgi:hypothetical protein